LIQLRADGNFSLAFLYTPVSCDVPCLSTLFCFRGEANGKVFEDTQKRKKPIVYIYGSRPFTAALCLGVEKGMKGMKAGTLLLFIK